MNTYLTRGNAENIQELFEAMRCQIPEDDWSIICCIGDFNVDKVETSHEKNLLEKLCKLMGLRIIIPTEPQQGMEAYLALYYLENIYMLRKTRS